VARDAQRDPVEWWSAYQSERAPGDEEDRPELHDPEQEPKGWRRASFDLNTHPLHPFPKVRQGDLLVPLHRERWKLFGACLVCGAGLSVLWVYVPLFLVAILVNDNFGVWKWVAMGAFAAVTTVALIRYASAKEEEYLEELE
jgi:hypothetical protein